jgi:hypothetical protein
MVNPALVLSSYPDIEAARLAVRSIRRSGIRRVAAVSSLPDGRTVVADHRLVPLLATIAGGIIALAVVVGYEILLARAPMPQGAVEWTAVAACIIAGMLIGQFLGRWFDPGVRASVLYRYRHWVIAGETLVIAEVEAQQARTVLGLLREVEEVLPATFIIRPHRAVVGRVAELQRRERFSGEQLKIHAGLLANRHTSALRVRRPRPLWDRLRDCERTIEAITLDLSQAVQLEQSISVSAEWLLDNAYVIQRHIADVRRNLSHQLYDVLPMLEVGSRQGEPRAYDLVAELVSHTDADVTEQDVVDYLLAYQQVLPLTMSELWALPLLRVFELFGHPNRRAAT